MPFPNPESTPPVTKIYLVGLDTCYTTPLFELYLIDTTLHSMLMASVEFATLQSGWLDRT